MLQRVAGAITGLNLVRAGRFDRAVSEIGVRCVSRTISKRAFSRDGTAKWLTGTNCQPDDRRRSACSVPEGNAAGRSGEDRSSKKFRFTAITRKLGPAGLCRVCLVEIEGMPKLQIACNTPATDGMVVRTRASASRPAAPSFSSCCSSIIRWTVRFATKAANAICKTTRWRTRAATPTSPIPRCRKPKAVDLGPTIVLDEERCVVCQRCVRFDDIIANERQLVVKDRGAHDIIATATGRPYRHNFTGNVTELVPGRSAHVEDVPLQIAAVGSQSHANDLHAVRRRLPAVRRRAVRHAAAHDVGGERRRDLGWLAVRSRPVQHRLLCIAGPADATALSARAVRSFRSAGTTPSRLWRKAIGMRFVRRGRRASARSAAARLTNEEAYVLQHLFREIGVENLDWRAGRQRQATPASRGGSLANLERAQAIVIAGEPAEERAPVSWLRDSESRAAQRRDGSCMRTRRRTRSARRSRRRRRRVALVWDGIDLERGRLLPRRSRASKNCRTYIASEQGNARGAEAMGMLPGVDPGYVASPAPGRGCGRYVRGCPQRCAGVLSIFGATRFATPRRAPSRSALRTIPFVVVSELFMTETATFSDARPAGEGRVGENRDDPQSRGRSAPGQRSRWNRPMACFPISR